jgi:hypothetical protein
MDVDIPIFGAIYCILIIIVGQFFLMNLILAVIIFSFIKTQKRELESEIKALNDADYNNNNENRPNSDTSNNNATIVKEEVSGDDL